METYNSSRINLNLLSKKDYESYIKYAKEFIYRLETRQTM